MRTAAVILANGFEEIEALTPVDYLRRAEVNVTTLSADGTSLTVTGSHGIPVTADKTLRDFMEQGSLPDMVIVPGGMPGASNIAGNPMALDFIKNMLSGKKYVAAICAAPAVVLSLTGALDGKSWTCYPGMEDYSDTSKSCKSGHRSGVPFVRDGDLITARGPGAAEEFAMELVSILCGAEVKEKIRSAACQR